jgi:hypothetical protein
MDGFNKEENSVKRRTLVFAVILTALSVSGAYGYGQKMLSAKGFFCGQTEPSWVNVHVVVGNSV